VLRKPLKLKGGSPSFTLEHSLDSRGLHPEWNPAIQRYVGGTSEKRGSKGGGERGEDRSL